MVVIEKTLKGVTSMTKRAMLLAILFSTFALTTQAQTITGAGASFLIQSMPNGHPCMKNKQVTKSTINQLAQGRSATNYRQNR